MDTDFAEWKEYFERNARSLGPIRWDDLYRLSAEERDAVADSIRQFQLGEQSEGKHLLAGARKYASRTQDPDYVGAVAAFIREEQRHAGELARFLQLQGIPRIRRHWADTVFRRLRRFAGLELSVMVLITAEIVAAVYYRALRDATRSLALQDICRQILQDEARHVQFQSETLRRLASGRSGARNRLGRLLHRALLEGTLPVVWQQHGAALLRGGFTRGRFCRECRREFRESDRIVAGRSAGRFALRYGEEVKG